MLFIELILFFLLLLLLNFCRIKFFKKPDWLKIQDEETEVSSQNVEWVFEVFELYKVDGSNEELFKGRFKRGEIVSAAEIRKFLTSYIKENNLQNPQNSK